MASKKHQRLAAGRPKEAWRRGNTSALVRGHPWRQECPSRKVRYATRENAQIVLEASGAGGMYRCRRCNGWHVTSQRSRRG